MCFVRSMKCTLWFLVFVLSHIVCGCLTDIFVFPLLQNCLIDRYLQLVSTRAHVGRLRLSVVNVWDAFCVLFRTFVFEKVHIAFCSIHEMHFMIFGFCSVAHCMWMSHGYFRFSSFTILYDRSVFAASK